MRSGVGPDDHAPGCSALRSGDRLFEPHVGAGPLAATHSVAIPNLPGLLAARVYLQAWGAGLTRIGAV